MANDSVLLPEEDDDDGGLIIDPGNTGDSDPLPSDAGVDVNEQLLPESEPQNDPNTVSGVRIGCKNGAAVFGVDEGDRKVKFLASVKATERTFGSSVYRGIVCDAQYLSVVYSDETYNVDNTLIRIGNEYGYTGEVFMLANPSKTDVSITADFLCLKFRDGFMISDLG